MITRTLGVAAIHCASCENTIRVALSRVDGVALVVPSAERNEVKVSFDESTVTEDQLRVRLGELGFEAVS
ncbi:MAG TPA: heavy-metal-associated domain-containing protein [Acidimicrobiales bacterium]|nr:heavy-metal-associated domain-containing protein [Acidimicrobiales bacterium]